MKKEILSVILISCLLTGCWQDPVPTVNLPVTVPAENVQASTDDSVKSTDHTEPTKSVAILETTISFASTQVETTIAVVTTPPIEEVLGETIDQVMAERVPDNTEPPTETVSVTDEAEDQIIPTEETISANEVVTHTESTELIIAGLDCDAAMNAGNQYGAAVYGWVADASLNESNAGFNFGSWVFAEEGQDQLNAAAVAQINFLYNDLKIAYPDQNITGIRFRVHAFECGDGLYEVRVYYA